MQTYTLPEQAHLGKTRVIDRFFQQEAHLHGYEACFVAPQAGQVSW